LFLSSRVHKTRFIDAVGLGPNLELGPSLFTRMSFTQCATRMLDAFFPRGPPLHNEITGLPICSTSFKSSLFIIWLDPALSWTLSCDPFKRKQILSLFY
jgi:hypothetical protein